MNAARSAATTEPRPRVWFVVGLLCLLLVASFVDRLILALLIPDVAADLGVTDTQMGFLIGTSFAVVYSLVGIPIAHRADRGARKGILVSGALLWGGMTIVSGFAPNFAVLAFCRAGVAVGEAVLMPCVVSLVADMFPRDRRLLPMALYGGTGSLMAVGALALCALALDLARDLSVWGDQTPWRVALILVGLPPIVLAVVFAVAVREPVRGLYDDLSERSVKINADFTDFLRFLRDEGRFYILVGCGTASFAMIFFAIMTWTPTLMVRSHGWSAVDAGYAFGLVGLVAGLSGSAFWPWLVARLQAGGHEHAMMTALIAGCTLSSPMLAIGPSLAGTIPLLATIGAGLFGATALPSLILILVQHYAPVQFRARLVSLMGLAQNLIAYGLSPPLVALLAGTLVSGSPRPLGMAMSVMACAVIPLALVLYVMARKHLSRSRLVPS